MEPMTRSKTRDSVPPSWRVVPWGLLALRFADWRSRRKRDTRMPASLGREERVLERCSASTDDNLSVDGETVDNTYGPQN